MPRESLPLLQQAGEADAAAEVVHSMSAYLDQPRRSLAEVREELLQRMMVERAHDKRACVLISAFDTLAMLDDEIERHRERYHPYDPSGWL